MNARCNIRLTSDGAGTDSLNPLAWPGVPKGDAAARHRKGRGGREAVQVRPRRGHTVPIRLVKGRGAGDEAACSFRPDVVARPRPSRPAARGSPMPDGTARPRCSLSTTSCPPPSERRRFRDRRMKGGALPLGNGCRPPVTARTGQHPAGRRVRRGEGGSGRQGVDVTAQSGGAVAAVPAPWRTQGLRPTDAADAGERNQA
jgi:hypothetical protein